MGASDQRQGQGDAPSRAGGDGIGAGQAGSGSALRPQSASFRFQQSANVQGWQATGGIRPSLQQHGTRYEIAVGGKPLTYRDLRAIAIATAEDIKTRNPKVEVTVCDLHDDELIVIQNPLPK
jgi:hypothetical protein